jgi:leucyl-tRNA synthetase
VVAERSETLIRQVLDDTGEILKATGMVPKQVSYYTAADWKWPVYLKALKSAEEKMKQGDFIKEIMGDPRLRSLGKVAADYAAKAILQASQMPSDMRKTRIENGRIDERAVFADSTDFLQREYKSTVRVWQEGESGINDPKGKARMAEPYRPAIFLE